MAHTIHLRAYAKINLDLRILGQRPDGFHELVSWMQPIDLCDDLVVRVRERPGIRLACNDPSLSTGDDNLVIFAAVALHSEIGGAPFSIDIQLTKRIPAGGGLGGGSADAAAMLTALARLRGISPTADAVLRAAATVGSDVPFFLGPGAAIIRGRGEIVEPHVRPFAGHAVLVIPTYGIATGPVFRALNPRDVSRSDAAQTGVPWSTPWGSAAELSRRLMNDLRPAACTVEPRLGRLLESLGRCSSPIHLSGSGSTLFALADDDTAARVLADEFARHCGPDMTIRIVRVLSTSPIVDATGG